MSEKLGLVGRKIGMTRIFEEDGKSVPVTVLDVSGNRVACVKTVESDGYNAVQVAFGSKKPSRVNKALAGQFAKAGIEAAATLKEFHIDEGCRIQARHRSQRRHVHGRPEGRRDRHHHR